MGYRSKLKKDPRNHGNLDQRQLYGKRLDYYCLGGVTVNLFFLAWAVL